jgi:hypothetical protein
MTTAQTKSPTFRATVFLLLKVARRRTVGRKRRQQELLNQKTGKSNSFDWGGLGFILSIFLALMINGMAAAAFFTAVHESQILAAHQGRIPVSRAFYNAVKQAAALKKFKVEMTGNPDMGPEEAVNHAIESADRQVEALLPQEVERIHDERDERRGAVEKQLREAIEASGVDQLTVQTAPPPSVQDFTTAAGLAPFFGTLVLLWWLVMLVCQGEGLELDMQRRRHPMWEWIFSHPVQPEAVFLAEMLAPLAANPIYWMAPVFPAALFGFAYGFLPGVLAFFVAGIPVAIAAGCLSKALEIAITLRCSVRTRSAMLGLMSWLGYSTMMLFLIGFAAIPVVIKAIGPWMAPVARVPWPWMRLLLGVSADGAHHLLPGLAVCLLLAFLVAAFSVWFSARSTRMGLSGNVSAGDSRPKALNKRIRFGKDPLYRKEMLWFLRDRGAIVQAFLIPLTVASFQLFNMRGLLVHADEAWNYLCGAGILFGTYFLLILGPKSLTSEGTALWISLTWPRGLESLLKAKAWLWAMISTALVMLIFAVAIWRFPASSWKILLVGVGWFFFSRSMAEKSVTLVTVTSESGEAQKVPNGRRWATMLGMLTFSIGILTQQWHLAVIGVVYSMITAAAMWQNFRARLPYLYDPWSEKLPPAPTLMHAMIAVSILVEGGAVCTGIFTLFVGRDNLGLAQAMSYGVIAAVVCFGMMSFLSDRSVRPADIWLWDPEFRPKAIQMDDYEAYLAEPVRIPLTEQLGGWFRNIARWIPSLTIGLLLGGCLGVLARGYVRVIHLIPMVAEQIDKSARSFAENPDLRIGYFIIGVFLAPFAEEYLFRGLVYRALDREWGGWKAILAAAAFFAIYHPALSWLPVATLGVVNAILYKKSGKLAPAVLLHMAYNAVVLWR